MKAPDAIRTLEGDLFRPRFSQGDLDTRRDLLFGSGAAGAGGRLLISPAGAVLVGGAVPFRLTFGDAAVPAAESFRGKGQDEGVININGEGVLEGIVPGPVWDMASANVGLSTHTEARVSATGAATTSPLTPETVKTLWQALKGQDFLARAKALQGGVIHPTDPRHVTKTAWTGWGVVSERRARVDERRRVFLRVQGGKGGCSVSAEASGLAENAFVAFPFGYYGRRGCAPGLTLSGSLEIIDNGTRRKEGEGGATLSVWRAATPPTDYLTPTDTADGVLPQWEAVASKRVTAGPFSIPLKMEGSTVYLFVIEAMLDPAFADDTTETPEPEADAEGHVTRAAGTESHYNDSTAALVAGALTIAPTKKPPAKAEG